jgi:hypothetical protein
MPAGSARSRATGGGTAEGQGTPPLGSVCYTGAIAAVIRNGSPTKPTHSPAAPAAVAIAAHDSEPGIGGRILGFAVRLAMRDKAQASGERSVAARDVIGSTIITGDRIYQLVPPRLIAPDELAAAQALLATLPLDTLPDLAPLPPNSGSMWCRTRNHTFHAAAQGSASRRRRRRRRTRTSTKPTSL